MSHDTSLDILIRTSLATLEKRIKALEDILGVSKLQELQAKSDCKLIAKLKDTKDERSI